ncbi:MAG: acyl carrier protein [Proteobacteria bacterium]|nr:acyl carrier protein [Pseudomonadota bacterium]
MGVTREQLAEIFVHAGVKKSVVDGLQADVPLTKQGLDSVDYPAILVAIKDMLGIEIGDKEACELKTLVDFEKRLSK